MGEAPSLVEIIRDHEVIYAIHEDSCNSTITDLQPYVEYTVNITTALNNGRYSRPTSKTFSTVLALRLILVGRPGVGKSTSGNTILGEDHTSTYNVFSLKNVTTTCQSISTSSPREMQVVDTPAIFDASRDKTKIEKDVLRWIKISCPGPHAFLLVMTVSRFSKQDQNAVRALQEIFGERVKDYMIVLFTRGDELEGQTIEEYVSSGSEELQKLIRSCGGRFHVFDNTKERHYNSTQVVEVVKKIDEMVVANSRQHFTNDMYEETTIVMQERGLGRYSDSTEIAQHVSFLPLLQRKSNQDADVIVYKFEQEL
ncbi:GTPase IMAP family member 7-like [Engraulis encrasicolus]|uniref:GTPase IMAP family member 7-like n=1 Tax=Engraulis encrasicolus TaxID=184585 RepID=UPI002FCF4988